MNEVRFLIVLPEDLAFALKASSLVRALKTQIEQARIDCIVADENYFFFSENPYIERLFTFVNKTNTNIQQEIDFSAYDHLINLSVKKRIKTLVSKFRGPHFEIAPYEKHVNLLLKYKLDFLKKRTYDDYLFESVKAFAIEKDMKGADVFYKKDKLENITCLPKKIQDSYIVLCLSSYNTTNSFTEVQLLQLIKTSDFPVVLIGSENVVKEASLLKFICRKKVFNASNVNAYNKLLPILLKAKLVMGFNDNYLQLAAALGKKIISFWGSDSILLGNYPPVKNHHKMIDVKGMPCRPCHVKGLKKCPKKHKKCINELPLERLNYAIYELINKPELV